MLQAQKAGCSLLVFSCFGETRRWAAQCTWLSSLQRLMPPWIWSPRPRWEKRRNVWSVSCHESYSNHEMCEGWSCCFAYSISRVVALNSLVFNLDFCIMNHTNGHDTVSLDGDNTHHRVPDVSWENIALWVNRLLQTDCIYNSPGANTVSRAGLQPYLHQHQKKNSYNSI